MESYQVTSPPAISLVSLHRPGCDPSDTVHAVEDQCATDLRVMYEPDDERCDHRRSLRVYSIELQPYYGREHIWDFIATYATWLRHHVRFNRSSARIRSEIPVYTGLATDLRAQNGLCSPLLAMTRTGVASWSQCGLHGRRYHLAWSPSLSIGRIEVCECFELFKTLAKVVRSMKLTIGSNKLAQVSTNSQLCLAGRNRLASGS